MKGLPTVRKQNPQAIIIAHQKTLQRMGKGEFLHTSDSVSGWMDACDDHCSFHFHEAFLPSILWNGGSYNWV
jgi:hypothetical protein